MRASVLCAVLAVAVPLRAEPLKVEGAVDARVVQTVIAMNASQLDACLGTARTDGGVLVLHWTVKDDDTVEETCQSKGSTVPEAIGRCMSERVASWRFPSPGYGQRASIEYTFSFKPQPSAKPVR